MIDALRSLATTEFTMLIFDHADLEGVNKREILEKIKCPLVELFDRQKNADRAKKVLKAEFSKAVALFLHGYLTSTGFDFSGLSKKIEEHHGIFERHLGKDQVRYLRLLINVARLSEEKPKRGLLGVA